MRKSIQNAILVLLVVFSGGMAAPVVTSVSGSIADGNIVTLTGSGFGSGPTVKVFDDFEGGTPGQIIDKGVVGTWDHFHSTYKREYSNSHAVSGTMSDYDPESGSGPFMGLRNERFREAFVSFWVRPTGSWMSGANWKISKIGKAGDASYYPGGSVHLCTVTSGNSNQSPDLCQYAFRPSGNPLPGSGKIPSWIEMDKWVRMWYWFKGSTGSDGQVDMRMMTPYEPIAGGGPGVHTIYKTGPRQTMAAGTVDYDEVMIGYYGGVHPHFDDSYIALGANACARIEITDNPDYEKSTKMGLITVGAAGNSWSSSEIKATCHLGSLRDGDEAWVHVFDSNNNRSQPFAVTIGEGQTRIRYAKPCRTNGQMDAWTNGVFDVLGRNQSGIWSNAVLFTIPAKKSGRARRVVVR